MKGGGRDEGKLHHKFIWIISTPSRVNKAVKIARKILSLPQMVFTKLTNNIPMLHSYQKSSSFTDQLDKTSFSR